MSIRNARKKEGKSFGESVIDNLKEFLDATERGELITVRRVKLSLEPPHYTSSEVKVTRERLRVSQAVFARLLGVSVKTVEAWESGHNDASGPVRHLLEEININPTGFLERHLGRSTQETSMQPGRRRSVVK